MSLKVGSNDIDALYVGGNAVDRVYQGANLVWEPAAAYDYIGTITMGRSGFESGYRLGNYGSLVPLEWATVGQDVNTIRQSFGASSNIWAVGNDGQFGSITALTVNFPDYDSNDYAFFWVGSSNFYSNNDGGLASWLDSLSNDTLVTVQWNAA